jgi:hypothetical protein
VGVGFRVSAAGASISTLVASGVPLEAGWALSLAVTEKEKVPV